MLAGVTSHWCASETAPNADEELRAWLEKLSDTCGTGGALRQEIALDKKNGLATYNLIRLVQKHKLHKMRWVA